jgi:hypothetical protein
MTQPSEGVPEIPELYPVDHTEFVNRFDAGYRTQEDLDPEVLKRKIEKFKQDEEKKKKEKDPDGIKTPKINGKA